MTCPACDRASRELSGMFKAGCRGCEARAVARSPQFFRVRKRQKLDSAYMALLGKLCLTHEEVKAAFDKDAMYEIWKAGA